MIRDNKERRHVGRLPWAPSLRGTPTYKVTWSESCTNELIDVVRRKQISREDAYFYEQQGSKEYGESP